jgi:hypothetical protein
MEAEEIGSRGTFRPVVKIQTGGKSTGLTVYSASLDSHAALMT